MIKIPIEELESIIFLVVFLSIFWYFEIQVVAILCFHEHDPLSFKFTVICYLSMSYPIQLHSFQHFSNLELKKKSGKTFFKKPLLWHFINQSNKQELFSFKKTDINLWATRIQNSTLITAYGIKTDRRLFPLVLIKNWCYIYLIWFHSITAQ